MAVKFKRVHSITSKVISKIAARDMVGKEPVVGKLEAQQATNLLVAKKCDHCQQAMHIHRVNDTITFAGCEPCIVDIKLERKDNDEIIIKGKRSTKAVRCQNCKHRHLLQTFKEVEDGVSKS